MVSSKRLRGLEGHRNPSGGINIKTLTERLTNIWAEPNTRVVEVSRDYQEQEALEVTTFKSRGIKGGNSITKVQ